MQRKSIARLLLSTSLLIGSLAAHAADKITLESPTGKLELDQKPARIVSLDYSVLDTLNVLGASDKVVGTPQSGFTPKDLIKFNNSKYVNVGSVKDPNFEAVSNAKPDIIFIADRVAKYKDEFRQIAPTYYFRVDVKDFYNSQKQQTMNIAKLIGKEKEAQDIYKKVDEDIAAIRKKSKGKTALFVLVNNRKISVFGPGSRFGSIYDVYGFTPATNNIKVSTHGQSVSPEFLMQKNPDYLFVMNRGGAIGQEVTAGSIIKADLFKDTKFAKNHHIVNLNPAHWYLMTEGLGALQAINKHLKSVLEND